MNPKPKKNCEPANWTWHACCALNFTWLWKDMVGSSQSTDIFIPSLSNGHLSSKALTDVLVWIDWAEDDYSLVEKFNVSFHIAWSAFQWWLPSQLLESLLGAAATLILPTRNVFGSLDETQALHKWKCPVFWCVNYVVTKKLHQYTVYGI